ncbi:MAG: sulfate adenylyltransferase [Actinomycetota bacterium]
MSKPHGGTLIDRIATQAELPDLRERANKLPVVELSARSEADVECIGTGVYSPLTGFMSSSDYTHVLEDLRLASGLVWSLPITLGVTDEQAQEAKRAGAVELVARDGDSIGILEIEDVFDPDKEREAQLVFGTTDLSHPGVAAIHSSGDVYLGGPITLFAQAAHTRFTTERFTPRQAREEFERRGWRRIVGFQTRNPVHRAHEYLQKVALESVDGLFLHPLVGETKGDDVPASVRMLCYKVLLENYYPTDRVLLGVYPAAMRYGGPREAVVHALSRKNYGCTHFIVGRDHAGVGSYYGSFDAQRIFDQFSFEEIGITIMPFENSFYCTVCESMATTKTCAHSEDKRVSLSGSAVRAMLSEGKLPPPQFSRPEVARVLIDSYRRKEQFA